MDKMAARFSKKRAKKGKPPFNMADLSKDNGKRPRKARKVVQGRDGTKTPILIRQTRLTYEKALGGED